MSDMEKVIAELEQRCGSGGAKGGGGNKTHRVLN